ncbi:MAG: monooxygenase [Thermaceae bacterium]|nr:monooxygenase [Thermaceae bacterium]
MNRQLGVFVGLLGVVLGATGVGMFLGTLAQRSQPVAMVMGDHRMQGQMVNVAQSDFPLSLTPPALAASGPAGETLTLQPDRAYTPSALEGSSDDYHCFLLDPKLASDRMVTGVNIQPEQGTIVHHVILFKVTGDAAAEAQRKNAASGGKGWTCFGGPNVGSSSSVAGSWLGAWVPGIGEGRFPAGLAQPLAKGSLIIMQVHYNLAAGAKPDRSKADLTLAPDGEKLTALRTSLMAAPVEIPCPEGVSSPDCNRTAVLRENVRKYGIEGASLPQTLLGLCKKTLEDYTKPVGDASAVSTSCERPVPAAATLYSVAGHMHLRGADIKLELIRSGQTTPQVLLHIPKWDFHWQGNYWFKTPVDVNKGDTVRISCTWNNSLANQPVINGKPLEPRYIVWGEGTTDEMCLGVIQAAARE